MDNKCNNLIKLGDFNCDGKPLQLSDIFAFGVKYKEDSGIADLSKIFQIATKYNQMSNYNNQESDVQERLDKLKEDAQKLYNGKFGSASCTLNEGCVELNNDTIISNKLLELSSQSLSHINIINHKISDNQYDIYILGDEILELLVNFEVPLQETDINVTDSYKSLFNNLFNNNNYKTNGLDAFKIYGKNLYVARLSNSEKIATNSINWNLKEFNNSSNNNNYKMFESKYPIKNVEKNRYINNENQFTDTNNVNIINI